MTALNIQSTELSLEEVAEAKKNRELERKFQMMVREIFWQVVLLALMLWVVVGNQDGNVYYQNEHLRNLFVEDMPTVRTTPACRQYRENQKRVRIAVLV